MLVNYSDLDKIASIHVQRGFLCFPFPTGNMLLIQIFPIFLDWGTVIRCRNQKLAVSFAQGRDVLDGS